MFRHVVSVVDKSELRQQTDHDWRKTWPPSTVFDGEVLSLRVLPRWDDRALSSEDKRVVQPPLEWRLAPRSGGTP